MNRSSTEREEPSRSGVTAKQDDFMTPEIPGIERSGLQHARKTNDTAQELTLGWLMKPENEGKINRFWEPVLACVEYVYRQASDDSLTGKSADTDLFAKASQEGNGKLVKRYKTKQDSYWNKAVATIRSIATKFYTMNPDLCRGITGKGDIDLFYQLVVNEILGLSIIQPIWDDPRVEEVWIDGPKAVRVSIKGVKRLVVGATFYDQEHVHKFGETILKQANRSDLHWDTKNPYVDARLNDLSRVAMENTDIAPDGPLISIRRHPSDYFTIGQLVDWGTCTREMWQDLAQWVNAKMSILVIGETGSGKTSFLDALSGLFPPRSRIMTIEDVLELELNPNKPFKVPGCEKREPNKAGEGGFSIRDHVKASLRMAPDIVVIGEVRDKAAYDLVDAANTGHQVFSTLHANGADDAVVRLMNLISMSGEISGNNALPMIASAFDLIVYIERLTDGSRKVMAISEVASKVERDPESHDLTVPTKPIWEFRQTGEEEGGKIIGEYVKTGELSPITRKRHRVDFVQRPSWQECLVLEGFVDKNGNQKSRKIQR